MSALLLLFLISKQLIMARKVNRKNVMPTSPDRLRASDAKRHGALSECLASGKCFSRLSESKISHSLTSFMMFYITFASTGFPSVSSCVLNRYQMLIHFYQSLIHFDPHISM
jgi:hypothetical protein